MYNGDINYAYLSFLTPILIDIRVNTVESNDTASVKLLTDLIRVLESLIQKITVPNSTFRIFENRIELFIDRNWYLRYSFKSELSSIKERTQRETFAEGSTYQFLNFLSS